jgi:acetyl esterase/lipase
MRTEPAHPPVHPSLLPQLLIVQEELPPSITAEMIPAVRQALGDSAPTVDDLENAYPVRTEQLSVPGPLGQPEVSLLVVRPDGATAPSAAIYYVHGGGMMLGNNRFALDLVIPWALEHGAVVVSVEYRLAPEHPDPAPIEDCYAGLLGAIGEADRLGIDPSRVLIAGGSAGGGLAAGVALLARDRKGPALIGQMLMCPMLDDRELTHSSHELDGEGIWDRISNRTGWDALLGDRRGGPGVSIYAAPSRATDLSGLPPAFIDVGSVETFRDEDVAYATTMWQDGGDAELHVWPGGFHCFDLLVPNAELSEQARTARAAWVRRLLGG